MKKIIYIVPIIIIGMFLYNKFTGKNAPKIPLDKTNLQNQNGDIISISNSKGNVMLVSYFQTWCGDCIREQPELLALQQAVGGEEKLKIFMITDESFEKINFFKEKYQSKLTFYQSEKSLKEIGIRRFPTTYLLDKNGNLIASKVEGINWNSKEMQQQIMQLNK